MQDIIFIDKNLALLSSSRPDGFLNLTEIWRMGSCGENRSNKSVSSLTNFFRSPKTLDVIAYTESSLGLKVEHDSKTSKSRLYNVVKSPLIVPTRGKYGSTFAHKAICLYAASLFNPAFFAEVCFRVTDAENILTALNDFEVDPDLIRDRPLFLCIVKNDETNKLKIGISKDPEGYLADLQSANHAPVSLIAVKRVASRKEKEDLISLNSNHTVRGDWFECLTKIQ